LSRRRHLSGATDGRQVYREWAIGSFAYRSDLIAHDYMRRWALFTPWGAIRLHKIMHSDDRAHLHDHPMDFASLILHGGYIEHLPGGEMREFTAGDVNTKRAEALHALELIDGGPVWTLVFAGPVRRQWGFMTEEDGWIKAGEYDNWKARRAARNGATKGEVQP
jgi:hypothetical protein